MNAAGHSSPSEGIAHFARSAICVNGFEMPLSVCQTPMQKPWAGNEMNTLLSTHHHRLLLILNK